MMRRDLLTAAPTFALSTLRATGAQPASARPKPAFVDPHAAWLQEWREAGKAWSDALDKYGDETERSEAMWARRDQLRSKIHSTQARTLEGVTAQVTWIIEESAGDFVFVGQIEVLKLILAGLQGRLV